MCCFALVLLISLKQLFKLANGLTLTMMVILSARSLCFFGGILRAPDTCT